MTFRDGPRFPFAVSYASAIQDGGDSFIVTGGTDGAIISDLLVVLVGGIVLVND